MDESWEEEIPINPFLGVSQQSFSQESEFSPADPNIAFNRPKAELSKV